MLTESQLDDLKWAKDFMNRYEKHFKIPEWQAKAYINGRIALECPTEARGEFNGGGGYHPSLNE